ncbi:MAG: glutaredoxin domain-containing protein [Desulfohalobiaceae bacterium]
MTEKVIYGKEGCPYCDRARADLPDYVYIDVQQDSSRLQEMLQLSMMQRVVPVIVHADGQTQIGYGGT